VCYFFFKDNQQQDSVTTALCAILHQVFSHQRQLIRHVIPAWDKNGTKLTGETLELWRIWLVAARDPEVSNVACVLDALDECKEAERSKMISLLTDFYGKYCHLPHRTATADWKSLLQADHTTIFIAASMPFLPIYLPFSYEAKMKTIKSVKRSTWSSMLKWQGWLPT
jgi:hypothetical protein